MGLACMAELPLSFLQELLQLQQCKGRGIRVGLLVLAGGELKLLARTIYPIKAMRFQL